MGNTAGAARWCGQSHWRARRLRPRDSRVCHCKPIREQRGMSGTGSEKSASIPKASRIFEGWQHGCPSSWARYPASGAWRRCVLPSHGTGKIRLLAASCRDDRFDLRRIAFAAVTRDEALQRTSW